MTPARIHAYLRAVSHSIGVHADALQPCDDTSSDNNEEQATPPKMTPSIADASPSPVTSASLESDSCDVCLIASRKGFALVPCGQARFCESCATPDVPTDIKLVMHFFN